MGAEALGSGPENLSCHARIPQKPITHKGHLQQQGQRHISFATAVYYLLLGTHIYAFTVWLKEESFARSEKCFRRHQVLSHPPRPTCTVERGGLADRTHASATTSFAVPLTAHPMPSSAIFHPVWEPGRCSGWLDQAKPQEKGCFQPSGLGISSISWQHLHCQKAACPPPLLTAQLQDSVP